MLFRVFLSVDHYTSEKSLILDNERRNTSLAKKMKTAAADLRKKKIIDAQLEAMVKKVADSRSSLAASTASMNQFVHNKYVFPKPSELRTQWDELQPFVEALWSAS